MKKLIVLLSVIMTGLSSTNLSAQEVGTVSVSGEGIVNVVPDQVIIRARVEHEGSTAQEVKQQVDTDVQKIFQYLKKNGIDDKHVKTEYLNLNKQYNYQTKQSRYHANQSISIKLVNIKDYEKIIAGLMESGLNRLDGISFTSSKEKELLAEARKKAMLDAKQKATEYASALGQKIGKAVSIYEDMNAGGHYPMYKTSMMNAEADGAGGPTIALGEMQISTKINVKFALLD
ncbi:SIMPL domain-containing protein [Mesonia sp. K7]|uniref:SIMPL domain-containing protein n=1 Tax=Mesonia sp. K7 TaxID=2218606 RepID=UPI000DAA804E|nr:SIMPL domain-containing protein [Mesonia sp. K7]PZD79254.1 SIMPL domain-containing protein [Mesonia sp. K7]